MTKNRDFEPPLTIFLENWELRFPQKAERNQKIKEVLLAVRFELTHLSIMVI